MKKLIIILFILIILISGCDDRVIKRGNIQTYPICDDGVVCYCHRDCSTGGMSCIKDKDLVEKYCD